MNIVSFLYVAVMQIYVTRLHCSFLKFYRMELAVVIYLANHPLKVHQNFGRNYAMLQCVSDHKLLSKHNK